MTISIRAGTYDDDPWVAGVVTDLLDIQFTAVIETKRTDGGWVERTRYAFYKDEGITWKLL